MYFVEWSGMYHMYHIVWIVLNGSYCMDRMYSLYCIWYCRYYIFCCILYCTVFYIACIIAEEGTRER